MTLLCGGITLVLLSAIIFFAERGRQFRKERDEALLQRDLLAETLEKHLHERDIALAAARESERREGFREGYDHALNGVAEDRRKRDAWEAEHGIERCNRCLRLIGHYPDCTDASKEG